MYFFGCIALVRASQSVAAAVAAEWLFTLFDNTDLTCMFSKNLRNLEYFLLYFMNLRISFRWWYGFLINFLLFSILDFRIRRSVFWQEDWWVWVEAVGRSRVVWHLHWGKFWLWEIIIIPKKVLLFYREQYKAWLSINIKWRVALISLTMRLESTRRFDVEISDICLLLGFLKIRNQQLKQHYFIKIYIK